MITLYSTHCPNCIGIEQMLKLKKIEFNIVDDKEEVLRVAKEQGIQAAPFAEIDGQWCKKEDIIKWIRTQGKQEAENNE